MKLFLTSILVIFINSILLANERGDEEGVDTILEAKIIFYEESIKHNTNAIFQKEKYDASIIAHNQELMTINKEVHKTQQWMTIIISFTVLFLIFSGLILAALEFKKGHSDTGASIKIGKEGVEFGSSVIGLSLLVISFLFFYVYVKEVYSIDYKHVGKITFDTANK